jgi:NADPH:quinone reductase-like Zn-dependent oxidoreductase
MKAAIYKKYGPPEVVSVTEVEKPLPKTKEVLIRVHASTVNRTDCGFRSANYFIIRLFSGLFNPKNKVLGCEFAGEVESVGNGVRSFKQGDKVFGFSDSTFGGHAEFMTMREKDAISIMPANMPFETAAALSEGAHYAWNNIRAAKTKAGDAVLVNGATGAIGSSAVQLLKYIGANVVAVCDTKNMELVRSLGADEVIDYTKDDFTKLDKKFDFVFDAVGKSSFGRCKRILKKKGIYISTELGKGSQNVFLAMFTALGGGRKVIFPLPPTKKEDMVLLGKLAEEGKFKPVIDREYPLEQIVEAYRYVETGMKTGNVVIKIS